MHLSNFYKVKVVIQIIILIIFLQYIVEAQVSLPDSPAGKRGQQIMDLLNGKLEITPKEFVKQNCSERFKSRIPENQWGGLLNQLMKMSPNVDLIKINKSEEYEIEFLIQLTANKMFLTVSTTVEESSPNYILEMMFAPGGDNKEEGKTQTQSPPGKEPIDKVNEETIIKIKDYLTELSNQNKFSGSVLVAKDGNPVFEKAYGYASKDLMLKMELTQNLMLAHLVNT